MSVLQLLQYAIRLMYVGQGEVLHHNLGYTYRGTPGPRGVQLPGSTKLTSNGPFRVDVVLMFVLGYRQFLSSRLHSASQAHHP